MKTQTNEVTIETGKMAMRLLKTRYGLDASVFNLDDLIDMVNLLFPVQKMKGLVQVYDEDKMFLEFLRTVKLLPDSVTRHPYNMTQCRILYKEEFEQWMQKAVA